jgi:acylphosphatase
MNRIPCLGASFESIARDTRAQKRFARQNGVNSRATRIAFRTEDATIFAFTAMAKIARRYFVSGIVQGVGFRYFTQDEAERLRLSGYVRNLRDGRVEIYAIGPAESLARLRSLLERGPRGAMVQHVAEESADIDAKFAQEFSITYDH